MHVCTCLWYHCIHLGMFLSIFVVIAVVDLTKFLHDIMLCCKYQQFIVNKYLWIPEKLKIGIHIQIFICWLVMIAQSVQGLTAGRIIRVLLLAARDFSHFCYIQTSCGTCPCVCVKWWALRKLRLWVEWLQATCQADVEYQNV
jgi:hypothetical protein